MPSPNSSLSPEKSDARRSQRLFVEVSVIVHGQLAHRIPFSEETKTAVVNAHGGLVQLNTMVQQGQTLTLQNSWTHEKQDSKVVIVTPVATGKFDVAMEFTKPNPGFWRVAFPPEDWSTHPSGTPQSH